MRGKRRFKDGDWVKSWRLGTSGETIGRVLYCFDRRYRVRYLAALIGGGHRLLEDWAESRWLYEHTPTEDELYRWSLAELSR